MNLNRSGFYLVFKAPQLVRFGNFEPRIELNKPLESLTEIVLNVDSLKRVGPQFLRCGVRVLFV